MDPDELPNATLDAHLHQHTEAEGLCASALPAFTPPRVHALALCMPPCGCRGGGAQRKVRLSRRERLKATAMQCIRGKHVISRPAPTLSTPRPLQQAAVMCTLPAPLPSCAACLTLAGLRDGWHVYCPHLLVLHQVHHVHPCIDVAAVLLHAGPDLQKPAGSCSRMALIQAAERHGIGVSPFWWCRYRA